MSVYIGLLNGKRYEIEGNVEWFDKEFESPQSFINVIFIEGNDLTANRKRFEMRIPKSSIVYWRSRITKNY